MTANSGVKTRASMGAIPPTRLRRVPASQAAMITAPIAPHGSTHSWRNDDTSSPIASNTPTVRPMSTPPPAAISANVTSHSPVNLTNSIRRASESQSPPTNATPVANHSTMGRWMAVSTSVETSGANGYTLANTAPATNTAERPTMPLVLSPRFQMK